MSGIGGLRAPARWHYRGSPIVYLAESPAGALLEACVHTSSNDIPPLVKLLAVKVGAQASIESLETGVLPSDWVDQVELTREIGSKWLNERRSTLLRIPSALVPATFNVLLNPLHPEAADVKIESLYEYPFDPRIKK